MLEILNFVVQSNFTYFVMVTAGCLRMQCMNEVLTGFTEIIESGKQDAGAVAWLRGIRADKKKWK